MDYATISSLLIASGYIKTGKEGLFYSQETNFTKGNNRINIKWQLGGYVKLITHATIEGEKTTFDTALEFVQEFKI